MNLNQITPLILSYNEQENLHRCLESLRWAERVVLVDSFSSDSTANIASGFKNVEFVQRAFDNHTNQWNFGLDQVTTDWTLTLDADYICTEELQIELESLTPSHDAYNIAFHYCIFGKRLKGSLYPPRAAFFRTGKFRYIQDGHTQLLSTEGCSVGLVNSKIDHDDRKQLSRWMSSQSKYAELEVQKLSLPGADYGWKDKIRSMIFLAPILTPIYCLFYKRLILDGWAGVYYSLQRTFAELILSLTLLDRKIRK